MVWGWSCEANSIGFFLFVHCLIVYGIKRRLLDKSHLFHLCIKLVLVFPFNLIYFSIFIFIGCMMLKKYLYSLIIIFVDYNQ